MTYTKDSLKVEEQPDGTLTISWDENDPAYAVFNSMTEQELHDFIMKAFEDILKEENNDTV